MALENPSQLADWLLERCKELGISARIEWIPREEEIIRRITVRSSQERARKWIGYLEIRIGAYAYREDFENSWSRYNREYIVEQVESALKDMASHALGRLVATAVRGRTNEHD